MAFKLFGGKKTDTGDVDPESKEKTHCQSKDGLFRRLAEGLSKTRKGLNDKFDRLIGAHAKLDDDFLDEVEEVLITADVGINITTNIVSGLRADVKKNLLKDTGQVIDFIRRALIDMAAIPPAETAEQAQGKPHVILVIGVNGSGKTTTIGKLSAQLSGQGLSVLLAAGDTFRAAAIEQLEQWANRSGADFVRSSPGADPSSVMFDAVNAAISRNKDIMIADTAGRLHNKDNLIEELRKIKRTISRKLDGAPHETLLVLDAGTGQNAINQAKIFHEKIGVTSIALTKLDGTAKGGVVLNIIDQLGIPVKYIGVGEAIDDLRPFDAEQFVNAIFANSSVNQDVSPTGKADSL